MAHGYTNQTATDGSAVTKSYRGPDAAGRCAREAAVLSALAGQLPVPPVLSRRGACLRLGLLPGVPGQDLISAGLAESVLRVCGLMLRRIHAISPGDVGVAGSDGSAVLVHGDYGPQNLLLDPAGREVTAVVDWEWAHAGDRVEDLAWCEWIIRMHHPREVVALEAFYGAYGHRPAWAARHQSMITQAVGLLARAEQTDPGGPDARQWRQRVQVTESWTD